jgi:hypothetical protein
MVMLFQLQVMSICSGDMNGDGISDVIIGEGQAVNLRLVTFCTLRINLAAPPGAGLGSVVVCMDVVLSILPPSGYLIIPRFRRKHNPMSVY